MALTTNLGTQRETLVPGGLVCLQSRPSITYRPGSIVCHRVGSELMEVPLSATPRTDLVVDGIFVGVSKFVSSSDTDAGGGSLDANGNPEMITGRPGTLGYFATGSGVNEITADDIDKPCFLYDDDTVYLTDASGTLSFAGFVVDVREDGRVMVDMSENARRLYGLFSAGEEPTNDRPFARAVMTSLAACAAASGVITATNNGALGAQDGVTLTAGQVVFIPKGTTNLPAVADAGPYVVTVVGTAGTKFVLTRPAWFAHGDPILQAFDVKIGGEGTLYKNSTWRTTCAGSLVIGTGDPLFFPDQVQQEAVLVAGHKELTNVPILSATTSNYTIVRKTADTCTLTVGGYHPLSITAGALGTATVDITACVAAGTINVADVSTLIVTITNF